MGDLFQACDAMGDFDACRFDFRLDNKGLTPSRRRNRTDKRSPGVNGTSFRCKQCDLVFDNRPALLVHKMEHNSGSSTQVRPADIFSLKQRFFALLASRYIDPFYA